MHSRMDEIAQSHLCIQTRYTAQNNCFHCPPLFPEATQSVTLSHTHTVLNRCAPLADLPAYPDMHMEPPYTHSQLNQLHKEKHALSPFPHRDTATNSISGTLTHQDYTTPRLLTIKGYCRHTSPLLQEQRNVKMDPL